MRKGNWRISRCCSRVKNCTALVKGTEQKSARRRRQRRRVNGLQLPLHPQQVVGWIALLGIAIGTFTVVIPYLKPNLQALASSLLGVTFTLHVAAHLAALLVDPAELQVREKSSTKIVPEFDRTKHNHVIENGRCHLCNINATNKRTKHCSICNKCIAQFDHHCKWLNNCIGGRNYAAFITCVISAVVSALGVAGVSATELALVNLSSLNNNDNKNDDNMDNVTLPLSQSPGTGSLIIISLVGILSAVAAALLIHLCFFHGYIACLGLTTYEYVKNKRERKIAKEVLSSQLGKNDNETGNTRCSSFTCNDNNDTNNRRICYQLSRNASSLSRANADDYTDDNGNGERSIYICSTHQRQTSSSSCGAGDENYGRNDRRNFHLYFSYETRDSETSIEVSSQTILNDVERHQESIEFKPSTPSPVSCCFSIINAKSNGSSDKNKRKDAARSNKAGVTNTEKERTARSCLTMRRIQSFLRTRLRRNSRQRSLNGEVSRGRKNKVNPTSVMGDNSKEKETPKLCDKEDAKPTNSTSRPPLKLPPLILPPRHKMKEISSLIDSPNSAIPVVQIAPPKRSQPPLRMRRSSFYKRPRLKMGPHISETAQLSPIPESEFSKPASPKTPPPPQQINHFLFPPTISNSIVKSNNDSDARVVAAHAVDRS